MAMARENVGGMQATRHAGSVYVDRQGSVGLPERSTHTSFQGPPCPDVTARALRRRGSVTSGRQVSNAAAVTFGNIR